MQVQHETLDESVKEPTISKVYRDLANLFLLSNANRLSLYWEEDHAIELKPQKTSLFGPLYNLSKYQLKMLYEYMEKNLIKRFIRFSKSSSRAVVLVIPKPDGTLQSCVDYVD